MKLLKQTTNFPLVSIILPTFNSEICIRDTLYAIKNQSYQNIEVNIIDGFSTDKTIEIIKEILPMANIYLQKPKGIYPAMNEGIRKSNGEFLFFLNSDDFISSKAISYLIDCIRKSKSEIIFLPTYSQCGYKSKLDFRRLFFSIERVFFSHSASFMISKKLHLKHGFYLEEKCKFNADIEFYYKLIKAKEPMIVAPISQEAYGLFTFGGYSANVPYYTKVIDEFNFRKRYITKDLNDFIYCIFIVPLSLVYGFFKTKKLKIMRKLSKVF